MEWHVPSILVPLSKPNPTAYRFSTECASLSSS